MSFFTYKDLEIKYIVDGNLKSNKEVIVILNGIMMSCNSWEAFKEPFSNNNTLIRYDMVDQGESSKVNYDYSQELQLEVLHELLNHLQLDKVNIVGISYGASIALQYVIKYPNKVNKIVIANGVAKTSSWLKAIGDGWNEVAATRNGLCYYNITIPYIYSPEFYIKNIQWMEDRKEFLLPIFSNHLFLDSMVRLTKSAETHDVIKGLSSIENKTLIIAGEEDFLTPVFEQVYLNENIKNSHLVVIPKCGHASMYEVPELFTSLSLGFINNDQIKII